MVKNLPVVQETWVQSLGWEDPLEKGIATQSSILAWRIPWTEEPCKLQSMGLQKGRHNCGTTKHTHMYAHTHPPTLLVAVKISIVQFSSVTQWCSTLCNPVACSMPGLPVYHQLLEVAQTHVHWVSDAIQPFHHVIPILSRLQSFAASGSFPVSQLFELGGQSTGVSILEFQFQQSTGVSVLPVNIQDWFPFR